LGIASHLLGGLSPDDAFQRAFITFKVMEYQAVCTMIKAVITAGQIAMPMPSLPDFYKTRFL
jgi:hypothetical protein